jgi:hypothetical protein
MTGGSPVSARRRLTRSQTVSPPDAQKSQRGKAKTSLRGYGTRHQKRRSAIAPTVATGTVRCARGAECFFADELADGRKIGGFILPGQKWDLGHDDHDRTVYTGPEHRRCNRATAGRHKRRSRRW